MAVSNRDIKDLLIQELENKRFFAANWDIECGLCGVDIFVDDEFCFMGNKEKVCHSCLEQIREYLEI